jgi:hypothetical protein
VVGQESVDANSLAVFQPGIGDAGVSADRVGALAVPYYTRYTPPSQGPSLGDSSLIRIDAGQTLNDTINLKRGSTNL